MERRGAPLFLQTKTSHLELHSCPRTHKYFKMSENKGHLLVFLNILEFKFMPLVHFVKLAQRTDKESDEHCLSPWENREKVMLEAIKLANMVIIRKTRVTLNHEVKADQCSLAEKIFSMAFSILELRAFLPLPSVPLISLDSPEENNTSIVENFLPNPEI